MQSTKKQLKYRVQATVKNISVDAFDQLSYVTEMVNSDPLTGAGAYALVEDIMMLGFWTKDLVFYPASVIRKMVLVEEK